MKRAARKGAGPRGRPNERAAPGLTPGDARLAALLRQAAHGLPAASSEPAMMRRVPDLQSTKGNRFVQRLLTQKAGDPAAPGGVLAREAVKESPGKTVFTGPERKSYPVSGKTLADAVKSIEAYQEKTGEAGKTNWKPKLSYKKADDGSVETARVTVGIDVTMPSWPGASKLKPGAKAEWTGAMEKLEAHEQRHVAIVKDSMAGVGESLPGKEEAKAQEAFDEALANLASASDAIDPFEVIVDVDA